MHTSASHTSLVREVTYTECQTQKGSSLLFSPNFLTLIFNQTRWQMDGRTAASLLDIPLWWFFAGGQGPKAATPVQMPAPTNALVRLLPSLHACRCRWSCIQCVQRGTCLKTPSPISNKDTVFRQVTLAMLYSVVIKKADYGWWWWGGTFDQYALLIFVLSSFFFPQVCVLQFENSGWGVVSSFKICSSRYSHFASQWIFWKCLFSVLKYFGNVYFQCLNILEMYIFSV